MSLVPRDRYSAVGDIQSHIDLIDFKLHQRRVLVDEDQPFAQINQVGDKNDILLATKEAIPEYYQMLQKEIMYNVTIPMWKTSVTRMIQSIQQKDLLDLQRAIVLKKKHEDLYQIDAAEERLFKDMRRDHEALVGIVFENVLFYQVQELKSREAQANLMPQTYKIMFTLKDQFYTQLEGRTVFLRICQYFLISTYEQMQTVLDLHKRARSGEFNQTQLDDVFRKLSPDLMGGDDFSQYDHKIKQNLAEFLDFDVICNQQLQAIGRASKSIFQTIVDFNDSFRVVQGYADQSEGGVDQN